MKRKFLILIFLIGIILVFCIGSRVKWANLFSPGELSRAHEEFDESGDCGVCHVKGKQLDDSKCLGCHEEIKEKIDAGRGLHAHTSEDCFYCHSEHHGKDYNFVKELLNVTSDNITINIDEIFNLAIKYRKENLQ